MAAGEVYETSGKDDWCRGCGARVTPEQRVTVWSSDWKIDVRVVVCPSCDEQVAGKSGGKRG